MKYLLGIRMRIGCLTRSTWKARNGEARSAVVEALSIQRSAVLRLSVHKSASEVNRSGGDAQVISRHRYLSSFC